MKKCLVCMDKCDEDGSQSFPTPYKNWRLCSPECTREYYKNPEKWKPRK
ncbi:MAG: hypothetical protein AABX84_01905 [Nanoarchaeota archaeon]